MSLFAIFLLIPDIFQLLSENVEVACGGRGFIDSRFKCKERNAGCSRVLTIEVSGWNVKTKL